jgi:hypothetical protein
MTRCRMIAVTLMKATDFAKELGYPVRDSAVLMAMLLFFGLLEFAAIGGFLGLFLAFLVAPALFRYLMLLLEARARGRPAEPPDIELFQWFGNGWSLFPTVPLVALIGLHLFLHSRYGPAAALAVDAVFAVVLPASLAVLAITHSPLESLRPRAVVGVIVRCGVGYWIAPAFLAATAAGFVWLAASPFSRFVLHFAIFYAAFAFHALLGGILRPHRLHEELDIPAPVERDELERAADLDRERTNVLNHAYGFVSRGNRGGGLAHVYDWLESDPDPARAWRWFFEQMLKWENRDAALVFAQQYLSNLLQADLEVEAVKLMMRCRLVNPAFVPLADDLDRARQAALNCHNDDLADSLSS